MGLRSLGLADLGAGLCKRNSVLNILGPRRPNWYLLTDSSKFEILLHWQSPQNSVTPLTPLMNASNNKLISFIDKVLSTTQPDHLHAASVQIKSKHFIYQLEIRSMERGICPIAVFHVCIKTFFLYNVTGQQRYQCYQILAHMTSSVT